jgi:CheY-like chemotaxis protein
MLAVLLPVKKKGRGPSIPEASDATTRPQPLEARHISVLIVDDVEDTRRLYEHFFNFKGARTTTAADGASALRSVGLERPDVIVLDLAMPKVTGWDVLRSLKSDLATQTIPVIVVSGQDARDSALAIGAASYCEKPCLPSDLLAEVLRVLSASRLTN